MCGPRVAVTGVPGAVSREVDNHLRVLFVAETCGAWVPADTGPLTLNGLGTASLSTTVPRCRSNRVHPLSWRSPLRSACAHFPPRPHWSRLYLPWFLSSSRRHGEAPNKWRGFHSSPGSALRFSQPLDGLLRARALRVYYAPQPRPGFVAVQGVLPIRSRTRLVVGPCPRAVTARSLTGRNRLPRPNGSTSRPCSANRSVPRGRCLAFPLAAPLFGFILPQARARPP